MSSAAHGRLDALTGRSWSEIGEALAWRRRERLAGWLEVVVAAYRSGDKDLTMFHAKQRRDQAPWDGAELDLLRLANEMAAPHSLLARLTGRTHQAVRSKASKCGFTTPRAPGSRRQPHEASP